MTSVSKNVYIDKLDDIVNAYIIIFIAQLKWNLLMQNQAHILNLGKRLTINIQTLKLVRLSKYDNIFVKGYTPDWRTFCDYKSLKSCAICMCYW